MRSLPGWQSKTYTSGCIYIFLIYYFDHLLCLCNDFYGISALVDVGPRSFMEDYLEILKCVSFDNTAFALSRKIGILSAGLTTPFGWQ